MATITATAIVMMTGSMYPYMYYLSVCFQSCSTYQRIFAFITLEMWRHLAWQVLSVTVLVASVKFFEEENLTDEEFEKYPVVVTEERESEVCEGVMEVEEIREVEGEEVSRMTILDTINLHIVLEDSKSKGEVEIWHRSV